jgi:RimJ/RimL family protein N-acetyltransferase
MESASPLQAMKHVDMDLAERLSIPVTDNVCLVPIGEWILSDNHYVEDMARWRFASRDSFFARFPLSHESFKAYLLNHTINNQRNLTFAIMRHHAELLGHMGLSEVEDSQATIDAVMISPEVRSSGLARFSLEALIAWSAQTLSIDQFKLEVLSSNVGAIRLYTRIGFEVLSQYPLRKVVEGDLTVLEECALVDSNVNELKFVMSLRLTDSPVT